MAQNLDLPLSILKDKVYHSQFHLLDAGSIEGAYSPLRKREMLGIMCLPPKLVTLERVEKFKSMMNISNHDIDNHWNDLQ